MFSNKSKLMPNYAHLSLAEALNCPSQIFRSSVRVLVNSSARAALRDRRLTAKAAMRFQQPITQLAAVTFSSSRGVSESGFTSNRLAILSRPQKMRSPDAFSILLVKPLRR